VAPYLKLSATELVKTCAGSKNERAWMDFIARFQVVIAAAVLRTAHKWGEPSSSLLDDLIQDTYLKLCENDCGLLRSFHPQHEDSIYGFLRVVAANVVHDHFKSAQALKRGASRTDSFEPAYLEPIVAISDGFDLVTRRLQLEQVNRILRQVTAGKDQGRKCAIFWLRHRQGLTAAEIAEIPSIGLTTEGVESVLMRLSALIRSHLLGTSIHREVKVIRRQSRSKRVGT
jgi:RNA polymerase sigma-70 factor (ECF subfamily)